MSLNIPRIGKNALSGLLTALTICSLAACDKGNHVGGGANVYASGDKVGGGSNAHAGGTDGGGGGNVVVCYEDSAKTKINSVELLDLWEHRNIYSPNSKLLSFANRNEAYEYVRKQLIEVAETKHSNLGFVKAFDGLSREMFSAIDGQMGPGAELKKVRLVGMEANLQKVEDTDAFASPDPKLCDIVAAANRRADGHLYVKIELVKKMSAINQVALVLHEAVYGIRRAWGEKTSDYTRRFVRQTMSGTKLENATRDLEKIQGKLNGQDILWCATEDYKTMFHAWRDANAPADIMHFQFEMINGNPLLNKTLAKATGESPSYYDRGGFFGNFPPRSVSQCTVECVYSVGMNMESSWTLVDNLNETVSIEKRETNKKVTWSIRIGTEPQQVFQCH